jgi:anti-anti-sigma regulatory factor
VLRITETISSHITTLKLEGKLLEPWTQELRAAVTAARTKGHPIQLDLRDVDYVDLDGAKLLRTLLADGVVIRDCSGFVSELLERSRAR